jgi:hypothetical protein
VPNLRAEGRLLLEGFGAEAAADGSGDRDVDLDV